MNMKKLFPFLATVILSGCAAGMSDNFSCEKVDGIGRCVSMTDINSMVDDGLYQTDSQGNLIENKSQDTPVVGQSQAQSVTAINPPPLAGRPIRAREDVRRITLFPYVDAMGNYHDTSVIYTIVSPTGWKTLPAYAVKQSLPSL